MTALEVWEARHPALEAIYSDKTDNRRLRGAGVETVRVGGTHRLRASPPLAFLLWSWRFFRWRFRRCRRLCERTVKLRCIYRDIAAI